MNKLKITPWTNKDLPTEKEIRQLLATDGLRPYRWSNGPYDSYSAHKHSFNKVIYVISGSICFGLPQLGKQIVLNAGDRLDLPAGLLHNAKVSAEGVVCLEAHR